MNRQIMFAYGSNMLQAQALERMPFAIKIGTGELINHAFKFSGNGVASVFKSSQSSVPGVIYSVTKEDIECMNLYEGYPKVYNSYYLPIKFNKEKLNALVYVNNTKKIILPPKQEYLNKILNGASNNNISNSHIINAYNFALKLLNNTK